MDVMLRVRPWSVSFCMPPVSEILVADHEPPSEAQVKTERKLSCIIISGIRPCNRELIRVLKNAGGSETALRLASDFKCDVCFHRQRPPP
jgi:hypothetical protein